MRINAVVAPENDEGQEVVVDEVDAGHVQRWMLLYDEETGFVFPAAAEPVAFHPAGLARAERWVSIDLVGAAAPVEHLATARVVIVYGPVDLDELEPLLPTDLYNEEEEALAHNGMCHETVGEVDITDENGVVVTEPVYCGRPSVPGSYYRDCSDCDLTRRSDSERFVSRQYAATYGPYPTP